MSFFYRFYLAIGALRANKSRSALTALGIVIGIASIILVMSVSQGGTNLILAQIQGIGSRTIVIEPGREPSGPSDFVEFLTESLKQKELDALMNKSNVPTLSDATPEVVAPATLTAQGEVYRATVIGTNRIWFDILDVKPEVGDFITEEDVKEKAAVVVIGQDIKKNLFGQSQAVGQKVRIKDHNFRVVGVMPTKGQGIFNIDKYAIIPYTTAQQYLTGTNHFNEIIVRASADETVNRTVVDIEETLRSLHDITDPTKDDFHVSTQADVAARVSTVTGILSAVLIAVAAISLVVGGIGIMNIMLVAVTERTREIGLRKSVGATNKDILTQFLIEAVVLTLVGGILGMTLGATLTFLTSVILSSTLGIDWPFTFPVAAAVIGFVVSTAIGLVFGLYPARQAAKKNPIEALRYE